MGDFNLLGLGTRCGSAAAVCPPHGSFNQGETSAGQGRMLCTQQLQTFQGHCVSPPLGDVAAGRVIMR